MESWGYIILGIAFFTILFLLWVISAYNYLARLKILLDEAWSGIDVQLKRRADLIPNLVATVKGYGIHEKGVLEEVTRLRTASMSASTITDKVQSEAALSQTLKTLFAIAEQYPQLKANENFLLLQKELTLIEQDVQLARRYYNGAARNYNTATATFPSQIIAALFNFTKVPYFEITVTQERDVPKVKF